MVFVAAFAIGVIAGLRAMTAPAAASWGARLGILRTGGTGLAFLGNNIIVPIVFTVLALGELVTDQLPKTPSRKVPVQFGTRILTGSLSGAAIAMATDSWVVGAIAGAAGAVAGTFGGAAARASLAAKFGKDRPAAIIEDVVAVAGAALVIALVR